MREDLRIVFTKENLYIILSACIGRVGGARDLHDDVTVVALADVHGEDLGERGEVGDLGRTQLGAEGVQVDVGLGEGCHEGGRLRGKGLAAVGAI